MKRAELIPLIVNPDVSRLPRGSSYTDERDAGQCLIALTYVPKKSHNARVLVRNCYSSTLGTVVENMREFLRAGARSTMRRGVTLTRLLAMKFKVVNGPFMVAKPLHNCMVELRPEEWTKVWTEHRDESIGSVEARNFDKTSGQEETPFLRLLKAHWQRHDVHEGWTSVRVHRLCRLWHMTPMELAELIQWAPGHMDKFIRGARGVRLPGPVAVWFYFLENVKCGVSVFPTPPQEAS